MIHKEHQFLLIAGTLSLTKGNKQNHLAELTQILLYHFHEQTIPASMSGSFLFWYVSEKLFETYFYIIYHDGVLYWTCAFEHNCNCIFYEYLTLLLILPLFSKHFFESLPFKIIPLLRLKKCILSYLFYKNNEIHAQRCVYKDYSLQHTTCLLRIHFVQKYYIW